MKKSEQFKKSLNKLKEDFESLEKLFVNAFPYISDFKEIENIFEDERNLINSLSNIEFNVCFAGKYSTGKSYLINAIMDDESFLESKVIPTTAFPTYIHKCKNIADEGSIIYYLDRIERTQLKYQYLADIIKCLKKSQNDIDSLMGFDNKKLKELVNDWISTVESGDKSPGTMSHIFLFKLLDKWEDYLDVPDLKKPGTIENSRIITEDHDDSIIIKKVEIFTTKPQYDDIIVLVDLPGLEAPNIRHEIITYEYSLKPESKYYIFVFGPDNALDPNVSSFIKDIYNNRTNISESFWIINKWDGPDVYQYRNLQTEFQQSFQKLNILVKEDRLFKVSCKGYFSKNETDNIDSINTLREKLFTYLSGDVFNDFIIGGERTYDRIYKKIRERITSLEVIDDDELIKHQIFDEQITNSISKWKNNGPQIIKDAFDYIWNKINVSNFQFIDSNDILEIKGKISAANFFEGRNPDEIYYRTTQDVKNDNDPDWSEYIQILIKQINVGEIIRMTLINKLQHDDIKSLSQVFRDKIFNNNNIYNDRLNITTIPNIVFDEVSNILADNNLHHRFEGVADASLVMYSRFRKDVQYDLLSDKEIFQGKSQIFKVVGIIGEWANLKELHLLSEFMNAIQSDNPDILTDKVDNVDNAKFASEYYKEKCIQYIQERQDDINDFAKQSLLNHFRDVKNRLLEVVNSETTERSIRNHVLQQIIKLNFEDLLIEEKRKRNSIKNLQNFFFKSA